ncbi:putative serine/threonine-protein kinase [Canna indica]|uniref:[RNA-polymerase]-subunit kinase n=1 Tax=Canna indica TaxID=4628 RepID=A0AAQ3KKQ2_9LILI|nr:putative serine/threonine-protein kinase [Canna indica]
MGCVASKGGAPVTPALDSLGASFNLDSSGEFLQPSLWKGPRLVNYESGEQTESGESGRMSSAGNISVSIQLRNLVRHTEGEQVAAGWPSWLSAVAGEAIQGWLPLKAESFEKLEKVGQGTYSNVFRACEIETGRIVALKKVHFDKFEPESVRFMAREIQILRKLDHPNIIKLDGIITSRSSCSIYLVFEYMEHDLAGLISCPDVKLSEPQIKCYMHQLLSGLEQCHSHGILHRDIKCANLLVNNEGILKIADFGLANILNPEEKQPLTSRVVTLWYRPPELLLGSTDYEASVDLWSVGCVFGELFLRKPILQGRTEVEQIHKIFKLCGSPPDEFWKKTRLPHSAVFRSQHPYGNCLQKSFDFLPESAFKLIETFLSIEPSKRGTASSALDSEYFIRKPYACDPSSLPKYQPNKEIDAKFREDSQRRSLNCRFYVEEETKRPSRASRLSQESNDLAKTASQKEGSRNAQGTNTSIIKKEIPRVYGGTRLIADQQLLPTTRSQNESQRVKRISQSNILSGPAHAPYCTGLACSKKANEDHSNIKSHIRSRSRQDKWGMLEASNISGTEITFKLNGEDNGDIGHAPYLNTNTNKSSGPAKDAMLKRWMHPEFQGSIYSFDAHDGRNTLSSKNRILGYKDQGEKVEFSGPLLFQSRKFDEFMEKHERHVRRVVRKSWFQRGQKLGNY